MRKLLTIALTPWYVTIAATTRAVALALYGPWGERRP